jgi:hypothetical protein
MKLPPLTIIVSLLCPPTAANHSRRHCRTLSVSAKKPASVAGFLYLRLSISRLTAPLLHAAPASHPHPSLKLITQTPSSF